MPKLSVFVATFIFSFSVFAESGSGEKAFKYKADGGNIEITGPDGAQWHPFLEGESIQWQKCLPDSCYEPQTLAELRFGKDKDFVRYVESSATIKQDLVAFRKKKEAALLAVAAQVKVPAPNPGDQIFEEAASEAEYDACKKELMEYIGRRQGGYLIVGKHKDTPAKEFIKLVIKRDIKTGQGFVIENLTVHLTADGSSNRRSVTDHCLKVFQSAVGIKVLKETAKNSSLENYLEKARKNKKVLVICGNSYSNEHYEQKGKSTTTCLGCTQAAIYCVMGKLAQKYEIIEVEQAVHREFCDSLPWAKDRPDKYPKSALFDASLPTPQATNLITLITEDFRELGISE